MKILLVGEYSGFHNSLKEGLIALGHEVILLAHEDGFKKLHSDISWKTGEDNVLNKLYTLFTLNSNINKLKNFDIIQFINPSIFPDRFNLNELLIDKLLKNNGKSFLVGAGDDSIVWEYWKNSKKNNIKYSWIEEGRGYEFLEEGKGQNYYEVKKNIDWNNFLARKVNGIIPILLEYSYPYKNFDNLCPTLKIPINTDKIKFKENIVINKPVVFHGLNRYGVKGTKHVEDAFRILEDKYPGKIDLIIKGKMPYTDYLELINNTNLCVDQTNSYSLAVNALTNMAMGKVTFGGVEDEYLSELGVRSCPAFNIVPDGKQIAGAIEQVVFDNTQIKDLGIQSREFIEDNFNYIEVAKEYLNTWLCK